MVIELLDFDKSGDAAIIIEYDVYEEIDEAYKAVDFEYRPIMTTEAAFLLALREGFTVKQKKKTYTVVDNPEFDIEEDVWTIYLVTSAKKKKAKPEKTSRGRRGRK